MQVIFVWKISYGAGIGLELALILVLDGVFAMQACGCAK